MIYFTYILQSTVDGRFYTGHCSNLEKRFIKHNRGYSVYTKKYRPWNLIWYTTLTTKSEAYKLEMSIKAFKSREKIIQYLQENPCVAGSENLQISDLLDFRESSWNKKFFIPRFHGIRFQPRRTRDAHRTIHSCGM